MISEVDQKYAGYIKTFAEALGMGEGDVKAAILRSVSLNMQDNNDRIRKVFCKAARGEEITIAAIGGSITAGASAKSIQNRGNNARQYTDALNGENCWFNRTVEWFARRFPQAKVNAVNAGIGATPSFLGTFRLDSMVLRHKPDLVTVEFSVNDPSTFRNLLDKEIFEAYESVVRRCLEAGIAVVQIFLNDRDNNGLQRYHSEIARYYHVPCISYHNAVYPDGQLICDWDRLSPDEIHPNNVGHALLAVCLCNYLDWVYGSTDLSGIYQDTAVPAQWMYGETFYKVFAQYAGEFVDSADDGFSLCRDVPDCTKWNGALVNENSIGTIRLTVPKGAKRVWVQYFNSPGAFETEMNGQRTVCNTTALGWPKAMWHRIHTGAPLEEDTQLLIKTHQWGRVIILGLLAAF